jgi:DNA-binding Lrp family transcriptional regulator
MKVFPRKAQTALDILRIVRQRGRASSVELAEELGERLSQVKSVAARLVEHGFLRRNALGYRLTPDSLQKPALAVLAVFGTRLIPNAMLGDWGAANRLLHKIETVLVCTSLDELT